jgi:pentatricopeptide repeat protein
MVLADMLKAGLEPGVHQYTELAGEYARIGDRSRAFMVLERMEAMSNKNKAAQQSSQVASSSDTFLPPPDAVMYTSLMAGFVIAKDVQGAEEVYRRFRQRYSYRHGENEALDAVKHRLALLRQEFGLPVMSSDLLTMNGGSWHGIVGKKILMISPISCSNSKCISEHVPKLITALRLFLNLSTQSLI